MPLNLDWSSPLTMTLLSNWTGKLIQFTGMIWNHQYSVLKRSSDTLQLFHRSI